jgi:hypothetical protein
MFIIQGFNTMYKVHEIPNNEIRPFCWPSNVVIVQSSGGSVPDEFVKSQLSYSHTAAAIPT